MHTRSRRGRLVCTAVAAAAAAAGCGPSDDPYATPSPVPLEDTGVTVELDDCQLVDGAAELTLTVRNDTSRARTVVIYSDALVRPVDRDQAQWRPLLTMRGEIAAGGETTGEFRMLRGPVVGRADAAELVSCRVHGGKVDHRSFNAELLRDVDG